MAKYKVLKEFKDVHTKEIYKKNAVLDITVKRGDEIISNLDDSYIKRLDEAKKKDDARE